MSIRRARLGARFRAHWRGRVHRPYELGEVVRWCAQQVPKPYGCTQFLKYTDVTCVPERAPLINEHTLQLHPI
jgi:hypothetical protein